MAKSTDYPKFYSAQCTIYAFLHFKIHILNLNQDLSFWLGLGGGWCNVGGDICASGCQ